MSRKIPLQLSIQRPFLTDMLKVVLKRSNALQCSETVTWFFYFYFNANRNQYFHNPDFVIIYELHTSSYAHSHCQERVHLKRW